MKVLHTRDGVDLILPPTSVTRGGLFGVLRKPISNSPRKISSNTSSNATSGDRSRKVRRNSWIPKLKNRAAIRRDSIEHTLIRNGQHRFARNKSCIHRLESKHQSEKDRDDQHVPCGALQCDVSSIPRFEHSTIESLLSSRYSYDSLTETSNELPSTEVDDSYHHRDRVLSRIARVKSPLYMEMIRINERAVRACARNKQKSQRQRRLCKNKYHNGVKRTNVDCGNRIQPPVEVVIAKVRHPTTGAPVVNDEIPKLNRLRLFLVLEYYQGIPAFLILVVYIVSTYQFSTILEGASEYVYECYCKAHINGFLFDVMSILVANLAMRATGRVWGFVDDETYLAAKFDLHNRIRLGHWDARALDFFNRHKTIAGMVDMVAFFYTYVTLNDWHDEWCKANVVEPVIEWYEDVVEEATEFAFKTALENHMDPNTISECEAIRSYIEEPLQRLVASYLCCFGPTEKLIIFPISVVIWLISATVAGWLGFDYILEAVE